MCRIWPISESTNPASKFLSGWVCLTLHQAELQQHGTVQLSPAMSLFIENVCQLNFQSNKVINYAETLCCHKSLCMWWWLDLLYKPILVISLFFLQRFNLKNRYFVTVTISVVFCFFFGLDHFHQTYIHMYLFIVACELMCIKVQLLPHRIWYAGGSRWRLWPTSGMKKFDRVRQALRMTKPNFCEWTEHLYFLLKQWMKIMCPVLRKCVCVKTGTLCGVGHMHLLIVHLLPSLCDTGVSVSAYSEYLVHCVGVNVSIKRVVPVKLDLVVLTLYEETKSMKTSLDNAILLKSVSLRFFSWGLDLIIAGKLRRT